MQFDFYNIMSGFFFGCVGYSAWRYGKKQGSGKHMILAVILMSFSYFVSNAWLTLLIGSALTGLLFWP